MLHMMRVPSRGGNSVHSGSGGGGNSYAGHASPEDNARNTGVEGFIWFFTRFSIPLTDHFLLLLVLSELNASMIR